MRSILSSGISFRTFKQSPQIILFTKSSGKTIAIYLLYYSTLMAPFKIGSHHYPLTSFVFCKRYGFSTALAQNNIFIPKFFWCVKIFSFHLLDILECNDEFFLFVGYLSILNRFDIIDHSYPARI